MNGKMTEKEKMLGGKLYDSLDPQLSAERRRARLLFKALNNTRDDYRRHGDGGAPPPGRGAHAHDSRDVYPAVGADPAYGRSFTLTFRFICCFYDIISLTTVGRALSRHPAVEDGPRSLRAPHVHPCMVARLVIGAPGLFRSTILNHDGPFPYGSSYRPEGF
jgi:hypothetical protein